MKKIAQLLCLFALLGTSSLNSMLRLCVEPEIIKQYTRDQIRQVFGFVNSFSEINLRTFFLHVDPKLLATQPSGHKTLMMKIIKKKQNDPKFTAIYEGAYQSLQNASYDPSTCLPPPAYEPFFHYLTFLFIDPSKIPKLRYISRPLLVYAWQAPYCCKESLPPDPQMAAACTTEQLVNFVERPFDAYSATQYFYPDKNIEKFCAGLTAAQLNAMTPNGKTIKELLEEKVSSRKPSWQPRDQREALEIMYNRALQLESENE